MAGRWDFYTESRRSTIGMAKMMFGLALLAAFVEFWQPVRIPAAALFLLYGCWCFNAAQWMQLFADLQAKVDMKLIALGKDPE